MPGRHESHVDWKHLAFYGLLMAGVVVVGSLAIWYFLERQSLVIHPEPLPKVTVVTVDASSDLAASWVRLLTRAELNPTLVALKDFNPIEGVVVFCDVPALPPALAGHLVEFVRRGGALVFAGTPPATPIGALELTAVAGRSDPSITLSDAPSPVLSRIPPGTTIRSEPAPVAFLDETPRMIVDARWAASARAAVMHMEVDRGRYLWFGFDPDAITPADTELLPVLRSAFRWVSGQPVSEGGVGMPAAAKTLTPAARRHARANGFVFSVDQASRRGTFTVRMINRGRAPLINPTVKIWLPARVTRVALAGDWIMKRNATLVGLPEEGACLVSVPRLTPNEQRVLKLQVVESASK